MSAFDDFFKLVIGATKDQLGQAAADFMKEATADGTAFRADTEASLVRWQDALAKGEIDQDMFQSLVQGQWDTAAFAALARASKAAADAKALTGKIASLALDTALGMIPGGPVVKELAKVGVAVATAEVKSRSAANAAKAAAATAAATAAGSTAPAAPPTKKT